MIRSIYADQAKIMFETDCPLTQPLTVRIYSSAVGENLLLGRAAAEPEECGFSVDRFVTGRDGALLRYETGLPGVCYCSEVYSSCTEDFPDPGSVKGLQVSDPDDAKILGVRHTAINVAINDVMRKNPGEDTERFDYDGFTYYINMKAIRYYDGKFRRFTEDGVLIYLILLCGKKWNGPIPEEMKPLLLHPDYDDEGTLSAFNVVTDEGIRWYQAFIAYITGRWAIPNGENGRVYGLIVSNEVTSQWIWGNAGHKTCREFAVQYTQAMRTAYLTGAQYFGNLRVYCSMDHFWGQSMSPADPDKYYGGLELLTEIRNAAVRDGDFYYNIAHHPYPEDLSKPDFWNDVTATPDENTHRITFKNLEVLAAFLYKEENLYRGRRRRVILSEQGFNSKFTPESEILQATAYGRAYRKVMEIPEIDAFILHAHMDNYHEFGLNLGLWRRFADSPKIEAPKPAYYLFKVIDQKDDTGKFVWERF